MHSFDVQSIKDIKRIDSTVVEEITTAMQRESNGGVKPCSAKGIARTFDRPVSTVHKILLNILHSYAFKISHVQELFPSKLPARQTCPLEVLAHMEEDKKLPWKILWTDEAHFHHTGYVNAQKCE